MSKSLYREIPLVRGVSPDQIIASALDFIRPGPAITGQSIMVDRGLSLRRSPYPDETPVEIFSKSARGAGY